MRRVIASLNAKACAGKRVRESERTSEAESKGFVDQKKIAGRNVNGKEGSILNTPEDCLDNGEYLTDFKSAIHSAIRRGLADGDARYLWRSRRDE